MTTDKNDRIDTDPAEREITVNQVVAWNIGRYRRASGLTQEQLGALTGQSGAVVSAAERSWDGKRTREFDAQAIAVTALALGVPLAALFLPPDDDGDETRYVITTPGGGEFDMAAYMARCVMPDDGDDTPAMLLYRHRFTTAAGRYIDQGWADEAAGWLRSAASAQARRELAGRLRDKEFELRATADEIKQLWQAIAEDAE